MKIVNTDQAAAWDGDEGARWVEHAARYETTPRRLWARVLEADLFEPTDRVLDVGCGTGASTRDAARAASDGTALGVDLSTAMLEYARERAASEGLDNVRFERADAQVHEFERGAFDIAISRFGCMFFSDPVAAFANIRSALRPGGRLAVLVWRDVERNPWVGDVIDTLDLGRGIPRPPAGVPGPFAFADATHAERVLVEAGFDQIGFRSIDEPMSYGGDVDEAFAFVRSLGIVRGLTEGLDDQTVSAALDALRARLVARQTPEGIEVPASAWLITATTP